MDWSYLGHAMWLVCVGELRILFDPLLAPTHHGGVFEVRPRRHIDVRALEPDFIIVSHRHPDHFDVASLRMLAELDADSVVLTADPLVRDCAQRLGFRTVAQVDPLHTVQLDDAMLLTTPSYGSDLEWGVMVASDDGVAWNQVDSVMRDTDDVASTMTQASEALARPDLRDSMALALVRWQPLLEVEALTAGAIGFPQRAYGRLLDEIAALSARAVVPASAGVAHTAPYDWMNRCVYPVPEARLLRDLAARCPGTQALESVVGGRYRVASGEVTMLAERAPFVEVESDLVPQPFVPLAIPELRDPNLDDADEDAMRQRVQGWVESELAAAVTKALRSITLVLEVVFPSRRDAYTLVVGRGDCRVERRFDEDYDVLNQVAGSSLCDVLAARRHWGEPLLGGLLRSAVRAYSVDQTGLTPRAVAPIFLYHALSYEESCERWVTASSSPGARQI